VAARCRLADSGFFLSLSSCAKLVVLENWRVSELTDSKCLTSSSTDTRRVSAPGTAPALRLRDLLADADLVLLAREAGHWDPSCQMEVQSARWHESSDAGLNGLVLPEIQVF
jgi:hypothetical protein